MGERIMVNVLKIETTELGEILTKTSMYIHNGYYGRNIWGAFLLTLPQWEAKRALIRFGDFRRQMQDHFDYEGTADVCFLNVNDEEYYGCVMFSGTDDINPKKAFPYKDYYLSDDGVKYLACSVVSFQEYIKALEAGSYVDGGADKKDEFLDYLKELTKRYKVKSFDSGLLNFFRETARDAVGEICEL